MTAIFVLMVLTHVNSGSMVTFQEFSSEQTCIAARDALVGTAAARKQAVELALCVKK